MLWKAITYSGTGPTVLGLLILLEKSVQNIFNDLALQTKYFLFELLHYTNTSDITQYRWGLAFKYAVLCLGCS